MERKLASIQRVSELFPIPGADNIEGCRILGWECVVKKGELLPGQLCVYFEVDSVLPEKPEFEFLKNRAYRIKTIKLRGQIAQGLALPLDSIKYTDLSGFSEDDDVTDILGVVKYEIPERDIPAQLRGKVKGYFPTFLKKTDEIRIQAVPKVLERHAGKRFYYTEKLDGSSFTVYVKDGIFGVCSRNLDIARDSEFPELIVNAFWKAAIKLDLERKMLSLGKNVALQGELIGPGIQQNKYKLTDFDVYFFNVWDIDNHKFYDYEDFKSLIESLGEKTVPILGEIYLNFTVKELVQLSIGKSVLYEVQREGIVFRPIKETVDVKIGRLSFKVINPQFLLKYE